MQATITQEVTAPLTAARSLGPRLRSRSTEIDELRRLPDDVVGALHEGGLLKLWVPAIHGGGEVDPLTGLRTLTELATHDTAVAWCAYVNNNSGLLAGRLDPSVGQQYFGAPDASVAGFAAPVGRAVAVDGGLRVSGRWPWGSGIHHATAVGAGVLLVDQHGQMRPRPDGLVAAFVLLDRRDVDVLDTWDSLGIRGSGSTDYAATDAFVGEGHWVDLLDPVVRVGRPLFRFPLYTLLSAGLCAVAIGIASRALEEVVALAPQKKPQGAGMTLAERHTTHLTVARAEATIASSKAFLEESVADAWELVLAGDEVTVDHRRRIRLATADGTQRCADAVTALYRLAGGTAVYRACPLERLLRDAHVVTQHVGANDANHQLAGALALGIPADTSLL